MLQEKRPLKIAFILIATVCFASYSPFCQAEPSAVSSQRKCLPQLIDSVKTEVESLRIQLHRIEELKHEYSDLKIKLANKYIDVTSLLTAVVGVLVAVVALVLGGGGIGGWFIFKKVRRTSSEIAKIRTKSERDKREIEKLRDQSASLKRTLELDIDRAKSTIENLSTHFRQSLDLRADITGELMREFADMLPVEIDKHKLRTIFDKIYQSKIHLYDLRSFISDLASEEKEIRIRAIWGIEGMGSVENIKYLQSISDNKKEDPDIRLEAQRAVDNLKRRFGVQ